MVAFTMDEKNINLVRSYAVERDKIDGPRMGDFVVFQDEEGQIVERISCLFDSSVHQFAQTSPWGSFYLGKSGAVSFSGGLNPSIPLESLTQTEETMEGAFWIFHHGEVGAHRGVGCTAPCRVFRTSAPYRGFLT